MRAARVLGAVAALTCVAVAGAQTPDCRVEAFHGATMPAGAVARMHVVNTGATCSISAYGVPAERKNPAESGSITSRPTHGSAQFAAPRASYTPERHYVGDDEFTFEAFARGANNQPLRLTVVVKVNVSAPAR